MRVFHTPKLSAIADKSREFNSGRAKSGEMLEKKVMHDSGWRQRLEEAARKDGRSLRDISLAAELSHGYLHGILRDGKEPTLDRFAKICKQLNLSLSYALMGVNISAETEEIIQGLDSKPTTREAILALLKNPSPR